MVGVAITVVCSVPLHVREEWSSTDEEVAEHVLSLICTDSVAEPYSALQLEKSRSQLGNFPGFWLLSTSLWGQIMKTRNSKTTVQISTENQ